MRVDAQTRAHTQGVARGHSYYSLGQILGVTVQPWADKGSHSTAMGRQRGSRYCHWQTLGSQYSNGQTLGVTVQPLADKGGQSIAMGRQKGVIVHPWADTRGHSTAMGRH